MERTSDEGRCASCLELGMKTLSREAIESAFWGLRAAMSMTVCCVTSGSRARLSSLSAAVEIAPSRSSAARHR